MPAEEWRVTFGQKYRRETHPKFPKAHPDGWVTIVAADRQEAERVTREFIGLEYACLYAPDNWRPQWFPNGEICRIVNGRLSGAS